MEGIALIMDLAMKKLFSYVNVTKFSLIQKHI